MLLTTFNPAETKPMLSVAIKQQIKMNFRNLKRANKYEFENWLVSNLPNISKSQKEAILYNEVLNYSGFYLFKRVKKVKSIWLRMSIVLIPFVWLILMILLPINFIITGSWGYGKRLDFILNWLDSLI